MWGISHISDQQWAGMVMIIVDMLAALTAACWIALKALAWAEWQDQRPRPLHVSAFQNVVKRVTTILIVALPPLEQAPYLLRQSRRPATHRTPQRECVARAGQGTA